MADTDIVGPVGTTDQDPDLSARPVVFNPTTPHIRYYGPRRRSDFHLQRPTS